jgi:hypothetical protein
MKENLLQEKFQILWEIVKSHVFIVLNILYIFATVKVVHTPTTVDAKPFNLNTEKRGIEHKVSF